MKNFTREQLKAIYRLSFDISLADEIVDDREATFMWSEFSRLGISDIEKEEIAKEAIFMNPAEPIIILSNLDSDGKKYVSALLTTLMAVDGEVADKEIALLSLVCGLCQLPTFKTVGEAMDYLGI